MTDGRHSHAGLAEPEELASLDIRALRKIEATKATRILGIDEKNLVFLDFEDTKLSENKESVFKEIVKILHEKAPVEVFFPHEREHNIDHRGTNLLVKKALQILENPPIEYKYIIAWSFPFYLLQHTVDEAMFYRIVSKFPKRRLFHVDISEWLSLKKSAIEAYKSQTTLMYDKQKRPVLKSSFVGRFQKCDERFFSMDDVEET